MIRQGQLIALVVAFLIGCAMLLVAGASGVQAETSKKQEARCQGTRTYNYHTVDPQVVVVFTTNDIPGCPKGGLLLGTDKHDDLDGKDGDDVIRGLGGPDNLYGGSGNDKIYAGPDGEYELIGGKGDDVLYGGPGGDGVDGGKGEDVLYGGDGNDSLSADGDGQRDKLYCGEGRDIYFSDKNDYVANSCEERESHGGHANGCNVAPGCGYDVVGLTPSASASPFSAPQILADGGGPSILLPAAALLLGSGILTYAILRRR